MAKATKYPKKFRQTLEKVKAKREAREAGFPFRDEDMQRVTNTLFHELLEPNSVAAMYGKIDEDQRRITMTYHLHRATRAEYHVTTPPWQTESPSSP